MGQAVGGVSRANALNPAPGDPATPVSAKADVEPIGAYLARQRKLRGISLDDLEAQTHIPRRSLERLESGHHDGDPDGFVRGFVRTVSEAIGLDAEDAVARMLSEPVAERRRPHLSMRRVGLVAALGLGAAAVLALLPGLLELRWETPASEVAPEVRSIGPTTGPATPARVRWDAVRALADLQEANPDSPSRRDPSDRPDPQETERADAAKVRPLP